jgi:HTH-type transcriptional regulator, sugar sensing transcriptional regulator
MDVLDDLISMGLTSGEGRVFLALLKMGPAKVGQVVKESHVSYSKVYDVLDRLSSKGLVSHIILGNVKHFNAIEPYRLEEYIKRKEQEVRKQLDIANKLIPELAKVANRNRQNSMAEIFAGDKGIRTAYEILLRDATSRTYYIIFIHLKDITPLQVHSIQDYIYSKNIRKYNKGA